MAHVEIVRSEEPIRLFKSDFLEFFTHIHPAVVLMIWTPVAVYFLVSAGDRLMPHHSTFRWLSWWACLYGLWPSTWCIGSYSTFRRARPGRSECRSYSMEFITLNPNARRGS